MKTTESQLFLLARTDWTPTELEQQRKELQNQGHRVVVLPSHQAIGQWRQIRG